MSEHTGWPALRRKLKAVLSPVEHREWLKFLATIDGRYDGDFSTSRLTENETTILSNWASMSREERWEGKS